MKRNIEQDNKQHIIYNKNLPVVMTASAKEIIRYSKQPFADVMPIKSKDLVSPDIGYCALSIELDQEDLYLPKRVVGFATQKGVREFEGDQFHQIRHLTVLHSWQNRGIGARLVESTKNGMLEAGYEKLCGVVNLSSKGAFIANDFEYAGEVQSLTGDTKSLYIFDGGQLRSKEVK